jgi:hypothetical protein
MRGQPVPVSRFHAGARIAKWAFFTTSVMVLSVCGPLGGTAQDFDNQPQVEAALKELADATKEAIDNLPKSESLKNAEDELDAAIRNNEAVKSDPNADPTAKERAQKAQDEAQKNADGSVAPPTDKAQAGKYREALRKRRAARSKLMKEYPALRDVARKARTAILKNWDNRVERRIEEATAPIPRPPSTVGLRRAPATLTSPAQPRLFPSDAAGPLVLVDMSGGLVTIDLPSQGYLARELQGSGVQELNQFNPSRNASGAGGTFNIAVNNAPLPNSVLYATFNYFNVDANGTGAYNPGTNFRLNLPGAEGGASGVSIGGNPLNQVTNIVYSNNLESFGGGGGIRLPIAATPGGLVLNGGIGISGSRLTMNQSFGGQIPGFNRDFLYATNVDVNSARVDLGLGLTQVMRSQGGGLFIFNGNLTLSPTTISGNGTDRFSFTGINPSATELNKSKTDLGGAISAGLSVGLPGSILSGNQINGPFLFIKGGYESRPGFPVIIRDGTNPSRLDLKQADIFNVSGGISIPLGSPPPAIDVESVPLQRHTERRGQYMETYRQLMDRYNEAAKNVMQFWRY